MAESVGSYPNSFYQIFASLQLYDTSTDGYVPPFRYYVPEQGRWLTPDPLAGDVTNPQSLNRYAYVLNNPASFIDPMGMDDCNVNSGSYERSGSNPCNANLEPPSGSSAEYSYDPVAGALYMPSAMPGGPSNQGLWPESAEMAIGEATYANHVNAVFASLYLQAQMQHGIPIDQLQVFLSMNPQIKVSFGLMGSGSYMGSGPGGAPAVYMAELWGYSIVENPLQLAGMTAAPVASPWMPVVWYGGSALPCLVPAGYQGAITVAAANPGALAAATEFGGRYRGSSSHGMVGRWWVRSIDDTELVVLANSPIARP